MDNREEERGNETIGEDPPSQSTYKLLMEERAKSPGFNPSMDHHKLVEVFSDYLYYNDETHMDGELPTRLSVSGAGGRWRRSFQASIPCQPGWWGISSLTFCQTNGWGLWSRCGVPRYPSSLATLY